ncbi:MAG: exopolyphosphatase [Methylococcaceae bacterium]|nr:MAG: exopolyphosphatase [Methylococcaceae bacterium]
MKSKSPEVVASVDLGSNSFHMLIAQWRDGQLHTQDRLRDMVRLGAGLSKTGELAEEVQARALVSLERFGQRVKNLPSGSVRAVGTKTLRTATNIAAFLVQAEQALGHPIEIISGIEEARLIYLGVARSLAFDDKRRLVIDIGGGSTEYIIGESMTPSYKESLDMGCVSMTRRFFADGKITAKSFRRAVIAAQQELEPFARQLHSGCWQEAIGASGTLRAVQKIVLAQGWSNHGITPISLEKLGEAVIACGHIDKLRLPELNPQRAPVFPGGLAILCATFTTLGMTRMTVSDGALREGLIYDLLGRFRHEDVRAHSVELLAKRFHADEAHAGRIIDTLRQFLAQIRLDPMLDAEEVLQWVTWAAQLHEIGLDIAHNQYHKHGAYVVENADLPGFSQQDQKLLAALVLAHRRKLPGKLFKELAAPWNRHAPTLAWLLRLAVLLHRGRHSDPLPPLRLALGENHLSLSFPDHWLAQHPLTEADLSQEAAYLAEAGVDLKYR